MIYFRVLIYTTHNFFTSFWLTFSFTEYFFSNHIVYFLFSFSISHLLWLWVWYKCKSISICIHIFLGLEWLVTLLVNYLTEYIYTVWFRCCYLISVTIIQCHSPPLPHSIFLYANPFLLLWTHCLLPCPKNLFIYIPTPPWVQTQTTLSWWWSYLISEPEQPHSPQSQFTNTTHTLTHSHKHIE